MKIKGGEIGRPKIAAVEDRIFGGYYRGHCMNN